ncbi:hypothetical protein DL768_003546 [Monosporascus sp. mg162]|nr:hypothetical protein DL768_003546 [Monosporascus sp. mg162]
MNRAGHIPFKHPEIRLNHYDKRRPEQYCSQATYLMRAGLQSRILLPSDSGYNACEKSYFSNTAKLKLACIIRPTFNSQVSTALRALVATNEKFAIRSGVYTLLIGLNNIHGGVTIDLSLLNSVRFDSASETHGRVVAGGREGETGVAGLLLREGNTWMTARNGFACDNVVAFEGVLADGLIVTANRNTHADLFRALKGGSNNFRIVVGFTMSTIRPPPLVFAQHCIAAGGNALGLEHNTSDGILLQRNTMLKTLDQKELTYPRVKACIRAVDEYTATIDGGLLEWLYLNYADEYQDVLRSYSAENVEFMRAVSRKCDPQ